MIERPARLQGKRALVTAAAAGIGRASALALAAEGAEVWATDIDTDGLASLPGTIHTLPLDVTDADAITPAIAEARPDILMNSAGIVTGGSVLDFSDNEWDRAFALNVRAMADLIRAALPGMLERGTGSIINVSSVASSLKGVPDRCLYGTTKAAVIGLTKSVAADFVDSGVRCNAICPGTVDTPSLQQRLAATGDYDAARAAFTARQPMGRLGTAEEIAALAVWLAGDESGFVTGQTHVIDGGWAI